MSVVVASPIAAIIETCAIVNALAEEICSTVGTVVAVADDTYTAAVVATQVEIATSNTQLGVKILSQATNITDATPGAHGVVGCLHVAGRWYHGLLEVR